MQSSRLTTAGTFELYILINRNTFIMTIEYVVYVCGECMMNKDKVFTDTFLYMQKKIRKRHDKSVKKLGK